MFPLQHTVILYSVIERKMVQSAIVGVFYITPSKWFTELHLEKKPQILLAKLQLS